MKKFTLLFMSLFFMLGTSMAKDETTAFELISVQPNSETPVAIVDFINLGFSKNITVTLPEAKIVVKSEDGNEDFEIVNAAAFDANAVFYVQKIVAADDKKEKKDDKEEDGEQVITYISTPGTYTYTIPAGVIKSVDNEEFPEQTFTFTVAAPAPTFPIKDYSPKETTKLEEIVVTFDEEITEVKASNIAVMESSYWSFMSNISSAAIAEDKKSVTLTLETPITTLGNYHIEFYKGIFVSANGESDYLWASFEVIDPAPSFDTNYKDGDRVKEIGNTFEITFKNVNEVKLVQETLTVYLPGGGDVEGTATLKDNKITVSFNQSFTEEGEYLFFIPEGMFTMDGVANEERSVTVTLFTFEITPLEIVSVTPQVGKVDKIDKIVITFNQLITLSYDENWQTISQEINLTCGEQVYKLTYAPENWNVSNDLVYLVNAKWNGYEYAATPITADGTYTLNLEDIVVDHAAEDGVDEYGYQATIWHSKNQSCKGTYTWTIGEGDSAVDFIGAEDGTQIIYDILGRRIKDITGAGIYIVNGKKTVIK